MLTAEDCCSCSVVVAPEVTEPPVGGATMPCEQSAVMSRWRSIGRFESSLDRLSAIPRSGIPLTITRDVLDRGLDAAAAGPRSRLHHRVEVLVRGSGAGTGMSSRADAARPWAFCENRVPCGLRGCGSRPRNSSTRPSRVVRLGPVFFREDRAPQFLLRGLELEPARVSRRPERATAFRVRRGSWVHG